MVRKNNCDHLFPSPAKQRPRIWLQRALLAVMSLIQNRVQSLGNGMAAVRALDDDQCEQKPSSAAQLWGNPWNTLSSDHLPVNRKHQCLPAGRTLPLPEFLPVSVAVLTGMGRELGGNGQGRITFPCFPALSGATASGVLSAAAPVSAEHLHRVTSLFPVLDDITDTAGAWCSHFDLKKKKKLSNYLVLGIS